MPHRARMNATLPGLSAAGRLTLRLVLFCALVLSGTVPQGMMRQAGADGIALVLCTAEGPQPVWMTPDGQMLPGDRPVEDPPHAAKCLPVTPALDGVQADSGAPARAAAFTPFGPLPVAERRPLLRPGHDGQPRAPPPAA